MSKFFGQEKKRISTICTGPIETSKCDTKIFPTLRLSLTLFESTDKVYPEFSFAELCKSETNVLNIDDPLTTKDTLEMLKMQQSAKHFEAKYNEKQSKPRKNYRDLVDLGEGYLEDSFIDNSEAYDEVVPSSLDTKYGGFYINCGKLDFVKNQKVEEEELLEGKEIRNEDLENVNVVKKRKLAFVENSFKKYKKIKLEKEFGKKKINIANDFDNKSQREKIKLKKSKSKEHNSTVNVNQPEEVLKNHLDILSKKGNLPELKNDTTKKSINTHDSIKNGIVFKTPTTDKATTNGFADKNICSSPYGESNKPVEILNQEFSVNAIDLKANDCVSDIPLKPLPTNLKIYVDDFQELIAALPNIDATTSQFKLSDEILMKLNDIEKSLSAAVSEIDRGILFMHLAKQIKTSPTIVLKRLRKFRITLTRNKLAQPKELLKKAIDEAMPKHLQLYQEELAEQQQGRLRLEQMRRDSPRVEEGADIDEKNENEKPKRIQAPRKKFHWTVLLRTLLNEIVAAKMEFFELAKIRSQTAEEYLRNYLDEDIKPLWPFGWITTRILLKESKQAQKKWTEDLNKTKKSSLNTNSFMKITENKQLIEVQPQIRVKSETKSETKNIDPLTKSIKIEDQHVQENKLRTDNYILNFDICDLPLNKTSKNLLNINPSSLMPQSQLNETTSMKNSSNSMNLINSCDRVITSQPNTSLIAFTSNTNANILVSAISNFKNNTEITFANNIISNITPITTDNYLSEKKEGDQNFIGIMANNITNTALTAIKKSINNIKSIDAINIVSSITQSITNSESQILKNEKTSLTDNNSAFFKNSDSASIMNHNIPNLQQTETKNKSNLVNEVINNLKDINYQINKDCVFSKGERNNESNKDVNKLIFDEAKIRSLRQPIDVKSSFNQNKDIDLKFKKPVYSQLPQNMIKSNTLLTNFNSVPSETSYHCAPINHYTNTSDKSNTHLDYQSNIDRSSIIKNLDTQIQKNNFKNSNEFMSHYSPKTDMKNLNSSSPLYASSVNIQAPPINTSKNALKNHEISTLNAMNNPYTSPSRSKYNLSEKNLSKSKSNIDMTESQLLEFEMFESEYGTKFAQGFYGQSAANMMPHLTKIPDFKTTPKLSPQTVKNKNVNKTVSPSSSFKYNDHWQSPSTMQYSLDNQLLMSSNIDSHKYWSGTQTFTQPLIGSRGNFVNGSSTLQNSTAASMNAFTNDPAEFIASFLPPDQFNEQFRNANQRNQHLNYNPSMSHSSQASKKY